MERTRPVGICVEKGETLPKALEISSKSLDSAFVDVSGFGELAWAEITNGDEDDKPARFEGPLQLLSLRGRIRRAGAMTISDFVCTLSRQTDNGISVIGGKLIKAAINHLEIKFTPLEAPDDIKPSEVRQTTPSTESADAYILPPTADPPPKEKKPAPMDQRWAKAVEETRRIDATDDYLTDDGSETRPEIGDKVNHRQFGECTVSRINDDHITLKKPDGRYVQLGLKVLRFTKAGTKDGHIVYDVEVAQR